MTASIINKTFKSIVAASAALIMAASVAACGPSTATPSDENSTGGDSSSSSNVTARTLDEIKKSGELKVAVFSDKARSATSTRKARTPATTFTSPSASARILA